MKHFKSLVAACVLALSLSMTAIAGEMGGPGFTDPPPPPPPAASSVPGEPTATAIAQQSSSDSIVETAIELMELFVSIF